MVTRTAVGKQLATAGLHSLLARSGGSTEKREGQKQKEQDKLRWEVESKQFMENHKKKHAQDVEGGF